jgi:hypothetical protein
MKLDRKVSNHPASGNAGIASRFAIEHHWPGVPESGRSAMKSRLAYLAIVLPLLSCLLCGCASSLKPSADLGDEESVTVPFKIRGAMHSFGGHPVIEATINGVAGFFIIDTGAAGPMLTANGARRCGIASIPARALGVDMWGDEFPLKRATNVTIRFGPRFSLHYDDILVSPKEGDHFGLLDFGTLKSLNAVMDMGQRTITLTK